MGRRWRCEQLGCRKNLSGWLNCKHCGAARSHDTGCPGRHVGGACGGPWPALPQAGGSGGSGGHEQQLLIRPGPLRGFPAGSPGADQGGLAGLSAEELRTVVTLAKRCGDAQGTAKFGAALATFEPKPAAAVPLQQRAAKARARFLQLERKLGPEVEDLTELSDQLTTQRNAAAAAKAELDAAGSEYKSAVNEL